MNQENRKTWQGSSRHGCRYRGIFSSILLAGLASLTLAAPPPAASTRNIEVNANGVVVSSSLPGGKADYPTGTLYVNGVAVTGGGGAGLASAVQRGVTKNIWISRRSDGAAGSGTQEDPFDGNTNAKVQAIITAAAAGSTLQFIDGTYPSTNLTVSKSLSFAGNRQVVFTPATGANKSLFVVSGSTTEFVLDGVTLDHGTTFREENNVAAISGTGAKMHLFNVKSLDFNDTLYVTSAVAGEVWVEGCQFLYTYGRASISNVSPYNHPCAAILGGTDRLIVKNNYFNGLTDPSFGNVSVSAPEPQLTPADNFVQAVDCDYVLITDNTVENCGIEGINVIRTTDIASDHFCVISGNEVAGAEVKSDFFNGTNPCVKVTNTRRVVIDGNKVRNSETGIQCVFDSASELNLGTIKNNTVLRSPTGIDAQGVSSFFSIETNYVQNSSEPVKSSGSSAVATELTGIKVNAGTVKNNTLYAEEPAWDRTTTITGRAGVVFTVSSGTGMATGGILFSYAGGTVSFYPVVSVAGNNVTVDGTWSAAFPSVNSGTVYYASSFANPTLAAGILFGTGTVYADGNTIQGHRYDVAATYGGGQIEMANQTNRDCHKTQAESGTFVHKAGTGVNGTVSLGGISVISDTGGTASVNPTTRELLNDDGTLTRLSWQGSPTDQGTWAPWGMEFGADVNAYIDSDGIGFLNDLTINSGTANAFVKFDDDKKVVPAVAGADYIAVTGDPAAGKVPRGSDATHAVWNFLASTDLSDTANIQLKDGTLALAGFGSVTGVLAGANGGTGVANSGKTITLGGNLTTSGANAVTFTTSGTTNVTFPTSGTLATVSSTKVYRALLNQTGTSDPVATVLENTLGGTVVWTRAGAGNYTGTLTAAFTVSKTFLVHGDIAQVNDGAYVAFSRTSVNAVQLQTADLDVSGPTTTNTDAMLADTAVEILVYP